MHALRGYAKVTLKPLKPVKPLAPLSSARAPQAPQAPQASLPQAPPLLPSTPKAVYQGSSLMNYILQTTQKYPDAVVITQIGGFYELYFDHALEYGPKLSLKVAQKRQFNPITKKHTIPMTGFPSSQIKKYAQSIVQIWGKNVIILSQNPERILEKAPEHLKRPIERIMTPGTLVDCVDTTEHNFVVAVNHSESDRDDARVALAFVDMNEGALYYEQCTRDNLEAVLTRLNPRELVLRRSAPAVDGGWYTTFTAFPPREMFVNLRAMYGESHDTALMLADTMGPLAQGATAALLSFLQEAYPNTEFKYQAPRVFENTDYLMVDASSKAALELFKVQQRDSIEGSVCSVLDHTLTSSGARLFKDWLARPLQTLPAIENRLDLVEALAAECTVRDQLRNCPDIKSTVQKLGMAPQVEYVHLWAKSMGSAHTILQKLPSVPLFDDWRTTLDTALKEVRPVLDNVQHTLKAETPASNLIFMPRRFDSLINPGVCKQMDTLLARRTKLVAAFETLQLSLAGEARYSPHHGYYFNVKTEEGHPGEPGQLPPHRVVSSTKTSLSYTTSELMDWASQYEQNTQQLERAQLKISDRLRKDILAVAQHVRAVAEVLDELDVIQGLATLKTKHNLVRPQFGSEYNIKGGWSLAVEQGLLKDNKTFTRNDCHLGDNQRVCMISGPNMGGKSTYLRQVALISIMAQMGSFVPAVEATVPILDRVFCRMGSGDDVTRGRSTFMVEMLETASILRQATDRSLAILDEVGRGTSEKDGVAIAFASIKHMLEKNRCTALFSTHYAPELRSALERAGLGSSIRYLKTSPSLDKGHIEYNYTLQNGISEAAHGISMAQLAGFPRAALARATKVYDEC